MGTDGKAAFDAFLAQVKADGEGAATYQIVTSFTDTTCSILLPEDLPSFKQNLFGDSNFTAWASSMTSGAQPRVLDKCGLGPDFVNAYAGQAADPAAEPPDVDGRFDKLFPGCVPFAKDVEDLGEGFFFVDTRDAQYPVLFWNHEGIIKLACDFGAFLNGVTKVVPTAKAEEPPVETTAKARVKTAAKVKTKPKAKPAAKTTPVAKLKAKAVAKAKPKAKPAAKTKTVAKTKPKAKPVAKSKSKTAAKPKAKTAAKAKIKGKAKVPPKSKPRKRR
jgi:hypothetical protein